MIPHVTNNDLADITELEAFRVQTNAENAKAKSDVKVTMLAFVIKAVVAALKKFPEFNASLDGDTLVYKQYYHIGFAADTPNGLVVPVLKNADQKGILQISQEMGELAKKARDGKLGAADMQGGCFSISLAGRHWWHRLHAHRQRAGSGHPGPVQERHAARVGRQRLPAAPDAAAVAVLRPPRHRRRCRRPLQRLPGRGAGRLPPHPAVRKGRALWQALKFKCPTSATSTKWA